MIELNGITKTYTRPGGEPVSALIDISLEIKDGEFVAIVGTSGSGKSTLMNILGLLDVPSAGSYRLSGQETAGVAAGTQAQWRNKRIGFVFQTFHLLPRTSALENVELPLLYSDRTSIRGLGLRALESVGLGDRISHRPSEL
jgi:putative ABC transport system ATP-binding protein